MLFRVRDLLTSAVEAASEQPTGQPDPQEETRLVLFQMEELELRVAPFIAPTFQSAGCHVKVLDG